MNKLFEVDGVDMADSVGRTASMVVHQLLDAGELAFATSILSASTHLVSEINRVRRRITDAETSNMVNPGRPAESDRALTP
jgi:hypothetical protein